MPIARGAYRPCWLRSRRRRKRAGLGRRRSIRCPGLTGGGAPIPAPHPIADVAETRHAYRWRRCCCWWRIARQKSFNGLQVGRLKRSNFQTCQPSNVKTCCANSPKFRGCMFQPSTRRSTSMTEPSLTSSPPSRTYPGSSRNESLPNCLPHRPNSSSRTWTLSTTACQWRSCADARADVDSVTQA